ncbi:MAG: DUF551 domain-containing protein [PVC group bacterium]|nr:DUF551 domain-containing protein [PVC group bacterium]
MWIDIKKKMPPVNQHIVGFNTLYHSVYILKNVEYTDKGYRKATMLRYVNSDMEAKDISHWTQLPINTYESIRWSFYKKLRNLIFSYGQS